MASQRLCITLDSTVLLEALVLKRLAALPVARRQAWLRSRLVNGMLWEGRAVRALVPHDAGRTSAPSSPSAESLASRR